MKRREIGFTLVETVIAIVILSTAGITLIGVMARMTETSAQGLAQTQGVAIARSYIDTILAHPSFDDISDFDAEVHNGARDAYGNVIPELSNYRVEVDVRNVNFDGIGTSDARLVTVTVTDPLNRNTVLSGLRTRR